MKKILYKTNQNHPAIRAYKEAVEKGQTGHHVVYRGDEWLVIRSDSGVVAKTFGTQNEAVDYARGVAKNVGTALFIHGADGRIVDRAYY